MQSLRLNGCKRPRGPLEIAFLLRAGAALWARYGPTGELNFRAVSTIQAR
jgi:hypothetical protein